jgi:hypothetical protein
MNAWCCASLVSVFGALGGVVNAALSDNGLALPHTDKESGVWCPGAILNVVVGAFAAFASWSLDESLRTVIGFNFSVLAGAFVIGVGGAKWISSEVDKRLLKESVKVAASSDKMPKEQTEQIAKGSALNVLNNIRTASAQCVGAEAV